MTEHDGGFGGRASGGGTPARSDGGRLVDAGTDDEGDVETGGDDYESVVETGVDGDGETGGDGGPRAAALAAVPANDPMSAHEIAAALDVPRPVARDALVDLAADGALAHRQVRGRLGTVDVWYRPREDERSLEERVDDALDELDVPGASELMRDWRRDAVREAYAFLRDEGRADAAAIVDAVYPTHQAGFDDAADWWGMVAPRLGRLPGVATDGSTDGDVWQFQDP